MTRILVVDNEPPQASRDGGSARMFGILRVLRDEGHTVRFASRRPWPDTLVRTGARLEGIGVEVVARAGDIEAHLETHGRAYDVVVLSRLPTAVALVEVVRRTAPQARLIYDVEHVQHLGRFRRAKLTGDRRVLAGALQDRRDEEAVALAVDAMTAVADDDAEALRAFAPAGDVRVVTALHMDVDAVDHGVETGRAGIAFVGFMITPENDHAARRLVDAVWPKVQAEVGPVELGIRGAMPPEWLVDANARHAGLSIGHVEDVDALLRRAAVTVVPIRGGAGIKSKVLHAFSRRLPVVAPADGLRGIPAVDGVHVLCGETDDELAAATIRILGDPPFARRLADAAAELMQDHFGVDAARHGLREAMGGAHG